MTELIIGGGGLFMERRISLLVRFDLVYELEICVVT